MNSKELLEQADKRIAEIDNIRVTKKDIEDLERLLLFGAEEKNELSYIGEFTLDMSNNLDLDQCARLRCVVQLTLKQFLKEKYSSLEKLLGIRKPATINPDFETAVQEMKQQNKPDPVEDKLSAILQKESDKIETKAPPIMTVERVKELYHDKDMTLDRVAKVFEVNPSALYRFVVANNLRKPRGKEPETECPTDTQEFYWGDNSIKSIGTNDVGQS